MKKWIFLFVASLVCLVVCSVRPVSVAADGETSVLEKIGKDADYLIRKLVKQKLFPNDGGPNSNFGSSVVVINGVAFIGSSSDSEKGQAAGAVYIYEQNFNGQWEQKQKLTAADGKDYALFGESIAVSGNIAMIGARHDAVNGGMGSVYVFEKDENGEWKQKQKLTGNDGTTGEFHDQFGVSVAVSGNIAIIGADSSASYYNNGPVIFEKDGTGEWKHKKRLRYPGNVDSSNLEVFGDAVAISGNMVFVSSWGHHDMASGAVYIFERDNLGEWNYKQKLTANDGESENHFGSSIAVSNNTLLIGTEGSDEKGADSGSTYIFEKDNSGIWHQKQKLIAGDGAEYDRFGGDCSLSDNTAIISASGKDRNSGAVYFFERNGSGTWYQKEKLVDSNGSIAAFFGNAVALSDNVAIICSYCDDFFGENSGSAYVCNLNEEFLLPNKKEYLVFKISRNSIIRTKDDINNKIGFQVIYKKRNLTNQNITSEETYRLSLSNAKYYEGFAHVYYIVDYAELIAKYSEICKAKFQLEGSNLGNYIFQQVGLRVRYDAPIAASTLKDVYVTDQAAITNEKDITVNLNSNTSGETVSWIELSNDWVKGYQVFLTASATPPNVGFTDNSLIKVPYTTLDELSAEKLSAKNTYYIWVRAVNILNESSPWVSTVFSPKPEAANFDAANSYSVADLDAVSGKLWYKNLLKVTDQDAAWYVIQRQNLKTSEVQAFPPISYQDLAQAGFCFIDTSNLEKHGQYKYTVYTKNALGIASDTRTYQMQVKNFEPLKGLVKPGWRELEVKTDLDLKLGPKVDPEGDQLTYYLYVRTPGAQDERQVGTWKPQSDNEVVNVSFADQTAYQWQARVADAFDGKEVPAADSWETTKIDTDALIITVKNDFGEAWGTKQQPLEFSLEKNPAKTYTNYQLNFGDETSVALTEGQTVTHQYPDLKTYQLTATAADAGGNLHQGAAELKVLNTYIGTLYDNEEWSGPGVITVRDDVIVPENFTLTIRPGTTLQMQPGASILVKGTLNAVDTSATGSINFDWQVYDSPWEGIRFQGGGSGDLRGVMLSHAERGILVENTNRLSLNNVRFIGNGIGLDYYAGPVTAANCLFLENQPTGGVYCRSSDLTPALIGCSFKDNTYLYIDPYGIIENIAEINAIPGNSGNVELD